MIKKITAFSLGVIMLVTLMSGCGKPANAKPEESLNLIFYSSADLSEYIKVSDYKNVKVDKAALDRLVNRELDKDFMLYTTDFPITDSEAMEGDLVNVTYTGYIDGEKIESLSDDEPFECEIGSGLLPVSDLETTLIGVKPGTSLSFELQVPDNYYDAEVAGKMAKFDITLNHICNYKVEDMTDELVTDVTEGEFTTEKAYMDYLTNKHKSTLAWEKIVEDSEVIKYPEELYDKYIELIGNIAADSYLYQYEMKADAAGQDVDEMIMAETGKTKEEFIETVKTDNAESIKEMAERDMKDSLIVAQIASNENLYVSYEDYLTMLNNKANHNEYPSPSMLESTYFREYFYIEFTKNNVLDYVAKKTKI